MKYIKRIHGLTCLGLFILLLTSCGDGGDRTSLEDGENNNTSTSTATTTTIFPIDFVFDSDCTTVLTETQLPDFTVGESCSRSSSPTVFDNRCQIGLRPRPDLLVDPVYLPIDSKYTEECTTLGEFYFRLFLRDQWGFYYPSFTIHMERGKDAVAVGDIEILPQWTVGARQLILAVAIPLAFAGEIPSGVKMLHPSMFPIASFVLTKK